ncbi:MAG TPA: hypothetical protein PLK99_00865, partial [Burkholderiales bacterium]|nr:hypothetical protein [Burkholderiales bacterium]
ILLYPWIGTGIVEKNDKGFSEWSRIRVIANRCRPILRSAFEKPERFRHLMMLSAGDYPKAIPLESAMAACRRIEQGTPSGKPGPPRSQRHFVPSAGRKGRMSLIFP